MLAHLGLASRLLNKGFAGESQQVLRNLEVSDLFGLARSVSSTRAQSSKQEPEQPKENSEFTARCAEIKEAVQALRASGPQRHELSDSTPVALKNAFLTAGNWLESAIAALLQWRVDRGFDLTEFRAGAQHAFHMVNDLIGSNEMQLLRPMMSPRAHEAFSDMQKAYKLEGCTVSVEVDDIAEQNLMQVEIHNEKHMARFGIEQPTSTPAVENTSGSQQAGEPLGSAAGKQESGAAAMGEPSGAGSQGGSAGLNLERLQEIPLWLAVTVRYRGRVITKVTDRNGQVLSEDDDRRSQYWKFARGPLPTTLPAQSIDCPWFLLTMQY